MPTERYDVPCAHCGERATVDIEDGRVLTAVCECDAPYYRVCPDVHYARSRCLTQRFPAAQERVRRDEFKRWLLRTEDGCPSLVEDSLADDCGEPRKVVQWRSPGYWPPGAADEGYDG